MWLKHTIHSWGGNLLFYDVFGPLNLFSCMENKYVYRLGKKAKFWTNFQNKFFFCLSTFEMHEAGQHTFGQSTGVGQRRKEVLEACKKGVKWTAATAKLSVWRKGALILCRFWVVWTPSSNCGYCLWGFEGRLGSVARMRQDLDWFLHRTREAF